LPPKKIKNHPWDKTYATRQINAIAANPHTTYFYVFHADERIDQRLVNPITVERVLREGTVIKIEIDQYENKTSWKYRVHWSDKYGWVDVVVKVPTNSKFIVITVIRRETF
jgi:hypothetical protein